jgi:predicted DNA-binding ribbon-helix-helix protein
MSKQPKLDLKSIVAASISPAGPRGEVVALPRPAAPEAALPKRTLKERARQLSVYLEPPVYDQLRDLAYTERTTIHPLMLEALDLLFKQRGALSIKQLTAQLEK